MNFAGVQSITTPEGDVKSIAIGGVTVWQKPNPLPYDALCEYVEPVNANSYVDSGVEQTADIGFEIGFLAVDGKNQSFLGSSVGWGTNHFLLLINNDNNLQLAYPSGPGIIGGVTRNVRHSATFRAKTLVLDGATTRTATANPVASTRSIRIFGNTNIKPGMRIYGCKLYHGSTLLRDFAPCRVGTAGALYDRANPTGGPLGNGLYGSETSTPLVAGPDKNGGAA